MARRSTTVPRFTADTMPAGTATTTAMRRAARGQLEGGGQALHDEGGHRPVHAEGEAEVAVGGVAEIAGELLVEGAVEAESVTGVGRPRQAGHRARP